jgi:hypothetical protein
MAAIYPQHKGVVIRLPSGSYLYYHDAKEDVIEYNEDVVEYRNGVPVKTTVRKQKRALMYKSDAGRGNIEWKTVYGGLLCENVVSATSRDIIVPAVYHLENAGFSVLGLVHDEIWGDAAPGRDKEFERLMCINPSWCRNMAIGAEVKSGKRYLK